MLLGGTNSGTQEDGKPKGQNGAFQGGGAPQDIWEVDGFCSFQAGSLSVTWCEPQLGRLDSCGRSGVL